MATGAMRETAKIIRFVPRARLTSGTGQVGRPTDTVAQRHPGVECGSGWYHEAAMEEEAERSRKS